MLIFAGIAAGMLSPDGCDPKDVDLAKSALCRERHRWGDFGTMLIFMISSFSGVTYVDFADVADAAGGGSEQNHGVSILVILVGLLGKAWLASWVILTMRIMAPESARAAVKSLLLLVGLFFASLMPLLVFAGIAAMVLTPPGAEKGCGPGFIDEQLSQHCKEREHYGGGGTMFLLMLSSFTGVTYLPFERIALAAGNGTNADHGVSILVIMSGLLGRVMVMLWATGTFRWFIKSAMAYEQQVTLVGGIEAQLGIEAQRVGTAELEQHEKELQKAIAESIQDV